MQGESICYCAVTILVGCWACLFDRARPSVVSDLAVFIRETAEAAADERDEARFD